MEQNYDFRRRLRQVHRPNRVNQILSPQTEECAVDQNWVIVLPENFELDKVLWTAAHDLQDYLQSSMGVSIPIRRCSRGYQELRLELDDKLSDRQDAFQVNVDQDVIRVSGKTGKGVFGGTIYIEDLMNLREAPFLTRGEIFCEPFIERRAVHSGFALDDFPDHQLNNIAHAGFNEIFLFIREVGKCANSYCDIQDLIDRAELYGLELMFFSYISCFKHPEEADAEEHFENTFGAIFKQYPKAKGIMFVGESAEFPSRDSATTGKLWRDSHWNGIPDSRPSPGWWPCSDYPLWLNAVKKSIQKHKPDATVALATYNWIWAPPKERGRFLAALPKDVQVMIPFEMFKRHRLENGAYHQVMDYTISETSFSEPCLKEMEMANQAGLDIGILSMTGGTPWNFGTAPYVPAPFQWLKKFHNLKEAKRKYGFDNFYDSHHMGWWPSIITDLGRAAFRQPETDMEVLLRKLTIRDYGEDAADDIMKVWRLWSDAMTSYVASNENQYAPFRIGPSYPLVFHPNVTRTMSPKKIAFPTLKNSKAGSDWLETFFQPFENSQQSPYPFRQKPEMAKLMKMLELWRAGVDRLAGVKDLIPVNKYDIYEQLLNLGKFIESFIITGIHTNQWYQLNIKLLNSEEPLQTLCLLDEMEDLAEKEIVNAENVIPCVEADSRLGWEPGMEYMTDSWHLKWKIKQVRTMIDSDIATYRQMINVD